MGSELVTEPLPPSAIFEKSCPSYLAMGMSYIDYWDGDPDMAKYVRKAHELRQVQLNRELWLQGKYVYDAFAVVMYNAFRKKGKEPIDYPNRPYALTDIERQMQEETEKKEQKERFLKMFERFNS